MQIGGRTFAHDFVRGALNQQRKDITAGHDGVKVDLPSIENTLPLPVLAPEFEAKFLAVDDDVVNQFPLLGSQFSVASWN
jgi:hypothetical protein